MAGRASTTISTASTVPEIGRVKKPAGSPPKISSDWRIAISITLPSTNASTSGPGSNPNFFIR